MNKYFFLIILILFDLELFQAQILNGSFESWEEVLNYEKPIGWTTNQDTITTRIVKDANAVDGNYSLKLLPTVNSSWAGCTSWAAIRVEFDSILPPNSVLTFYLKSVPENPDEDSLVYFIIFGHTLNSDTVLSGYDWRTFTPVEEFTRIEVPLPGENIDELGIIMYGGASTHPADGPCLGRSFSWIDGMTIDSKTSIRPPLTHEKMDIDVYPIPSTGIVNIASHGVYNIRYELYTAFGRLIDSGNIEEGQLIIHDQGIFILKLYAGFDSHNIYSTKIVVIK